ncbi:methyltransferase domain-containing protein [Aliifodinibius salicampi]|uniref:Methyltransferase domain-containing protein n=1 Tax=Fodinibius salicampi TaxID=1920655 RepID=A0ABT3PW51_9BACT|nr:methyltransferase domain-containing protein [Fodinibius salicampi]MCW9712072.1 methyltransferase domain-containing protein [Fodinibius salicampi]
MSESEMRAVKKEITSGFSESAVHYEKYADLQKQMADRLIASLEPWTAIIPEGPIIELGCGTGFVTEGLLELYPDRKIECVDIAPGMIDYCQQKFADNDNVTFQVKDAEELIPDQPEYALTISGFTPHWFQNPAITLKKWLEATKPGGLLLTSFPGSESFPQWREYCQQLGIPYTGNILPDVEEMVIKMSLGPAQVDYYEDTIYQSFESARNFFEYLKKIGAGTQTEGRGLTKREMNLLINEWDASSTGDTVKVSWHGVFLAVKRDYD